MSEPVGYLSFQESIERVASAASLLVASDFDGTLSEIVEDPESAEPIDGVVEVLDGLAKLPGTKVAVVSGRGHGDLQDRLGNIRGVLLIGEHGNDFGEETAEDPRLPQIRGFVDDLRHQLGPLRVEAKKKSMAIHTRGIPRERSTAVASAIRRWSLDNAWAKLLEGKEVFELSLPARTKAHAVADLRDRDAIVLFFGDDVTDETVFESLDTHDVGVKVGSGPTSAKRRVADPQEVVSTLRHVLHLRRDALGQ